MKHNKESNTPLVHMGYAMRQVEPSSTNADHEKPVELLWDLTTHQLLGDIDDSTNVRIMFEFSEIPRLAGTPVAKDLLRKSYPKDYRFDYIGSTMYPTRQYLFEFQSVMSNYIQRGFSMVAEEKGIDISKVSTADIPWVCFNRQSKCIEYPKMMHAVMKIGTSFAIRIDYETSDENTPMIIQLTLITSPQHKTNEKEILRLKNDIRIMNSSITENLGLFSLINMHPDTGVPEETEIEKTGEFLIPADIVKLISEARESKQPHSK